MNVTEKRKKLLSDALDTLYELEDLTDYENENIGEAINLLQDIIECPKCKDNSIYIDSSNKRYAICNGCNHSFKI